MSNIEKDVYPLLYKSNDERPRAGVEAQCTAKKKCTLKGTCKYFVILEIINCNCQAIL